jgi:hypothetical protein
VDKLVVVRRAGALYKTGTILKRYDNGYCRQELTEIRPGRFTYKDVGFLIAHEKLDPYVLPIRGIQWENTADGPFVPDQETVVSDHGMPLHSRTLPEEETPFDDDLLN